MSPSIVILGGGTAGWIAAHLFERAWPDAAITVVESPEIGTIGVGEGSTPSLKRFFEIIGAAEADWMPRCGATYKAGIRFVDWSPAAPWRDYRHPFTTQIDVHTEDAFVLNCRNRRLGHDVPVRPDDFLLNGVLSAKGLAPVAPPNFPFRIEYGYHFDAGLLGQYLRELAVARGVVHRPAKVTEVRRAENGDIAALVTDREETIAGDIFVDCSGFNGLLIERTLGVPFHSFKDHLFNDAAVVLPTEMTGRPPVETVATALSNGWCWSIPLRHRVGNGYVYARDCQSSDAAETELRRTLGVGDEVAARHLTFRVGQVARHWERNCVAVGLSQGFVEPLEATALHLVLGTVEQFIRHYRDGGCTDRHRAAFNTVAAERMDGVRDYIVAHYKLNTRTDTDYWRANAANEALPDPLLHILDRWFRRGDIAEELARQGQRSHFGNLSWHCLLAGYGAFPAVSEARRDDMDFYAARTVSAFLEGCSLNFAQA
ncbi:tryptophan halogenase [Sphingomonas sp. Leaf24]|uniref:tryptophan halogenase family protein n=1 Tax=unclassified Sphingomonas TaxID=196159 RepID=UPI0006FFA771|nr:MULTISPECIES: tryptophan halogenase family protein [unclassified Sphingomonas]KQM12907.1 tryptophan halogenase [Sphingomonas sp. Leaf5]KQM94545.1 tryptophan halogenase [Sphingomonas sp. Leaf24]KQM95405.1 tryptophan halogenase [Sphingomonas sp. Leaf22]